MTLKQDSWPTYMSAALDSVQQECSEIESECQAFRRFRQRIQRLEIRRPQIEKPSFDTQEIYSRSEYSVHGIIEPHYRETVMAVDHYDDVYDDTFETSIRAEFGVAVELLLSETTTFSPVVKQGLLDAVQQCIDNRQVFLETLNDESITLKEAQSGAQEIQQTVLEIDDEQLNTLSVTQQINRYETLQSLKDECEGWLRRRQEQLHDSHSKNTYGEDRNDDLYPYLYASLDVSHPVLSAFTVIHNQIEILQQQITRSLVSRTV